MASGVLEKEFRFFAISAQDAQSLYQLGKLGIDKASCPGRAVFYT
jgi:hypothetical protein